MHVAGPCAGRSRGRPEQEARRDEHPAQGHLDAVVEAAAVGPPHREQAHEGIDVGVGDGTPVRPPGQRGQDAPCARRIGLAGGRAADEQASPALGVAGPGHPVGAADEHVVDGDAVGRPAAGALAPGVLGEQPRRDLVLARREGRPHLEDAAALVRLLGVEVGVEQADPGAVDAHVELRGRHAGGAPSADAHLNRVLGVEGKVVIEQDAAARVGGQPRDLSVPPRPARGTVALHDGDGGAGADHEPADAPRRRHVLLDVQRRHRQHVADVVEPVAGVVGRQVPRVVEVEPQEVADGVAVLGPVQPVDGRRAGVGALGRRPVEPGLEPRHELLPFAGVRGGPPGRRHLPREKLVQDLLEDRRLLPRRRVAHAGQGQAGGPRPVVVAREAVTVDGGLQEVAGRWRGSSAALGCRRAGGEPRGRGRTPERDDRPAGRIPAHGDGFGQGVAGFRNPTPGPPIPRAGEGNRERRGRDRLTGSVPPGGDEVPGRERRYRRDRLAGRAPNRGGNAC